MRRCKPAALLPDGGVPKQTQERSPPPCTIAQTSRRTNQPGNSTHPPASVLRPLPISRSPGLPILNLKNTSNSITGTWGAGPGALHVPSCIAPDQIKVQCTQPGGESAGAYVSVSSTGLIVFLGPFSQLDITPSLWYNCSAPTRSLNPVRAHGNIDGQRSPRSESLGFRSGGCFPA